MTNIVQVLRKIHIHPLLWLVVALAVATAHFIELSLLLLIIFIHEMGHAVAASFFSWRIKKISFLPFGGVAEMDEHGNRPLKEEAIVILAGPLQHIWMMGLAFALYEFYLLPENLYHLFIQYNLMILIFNLLPIWPLDGGKLIFLWLSLKDSFPAAFNKTLIISASSIAVFIMAVLLTEPLNLNVWIVLSFLIFSLYHEWKQSPYVFIRFLLERHYGKNNDLRALKPLKVREDELVIQVLERFQRGYKHPIIIEKNGKEKATIDENELLHAYFTDKLLTTKVGDLIYQY
ncbi:M50 family metallopeptidase (plasmid) [Bacillus sp. 31A1R]|uniref:M50 family metallopeptidase n=1 Tax=Robertmurraya mangrovi TaxID=3098077 RepID=A0ABU5IUH6_9BACI|nr:M50 family metallopeptidase [Bacillus sp. 31A1R]MDZ5470822.1 M50 family metallopeptidase [Bacillus sp. 31A1R]